MSIRSINDGTIFGGRREETQEDANEIQIRIIYFLHTNSYVITHMYQFVASLFYSTLFCCGGKANLVRFTLFYSTLLALTHRRTDRQTDRETNSLASRGLEEPAHASRGLFLINTLLLYPSLSPYFQTDGRTDRRTDGLTDRETNTLALRGLEEPAHALRGLFPINTLLLYPSLSPYSQTDGQTDRRTDRQRNEYTCFAWAEGTCPRFAWAFSDKHSFTLSFS